MTVACDGPGSTQGGSLQHAGSAGACNLPAFPVGPVDALPASALPVHSAGVGAASYAFITAVKKHRANWQKDIRWAAAHGCRQVALACGTLTQH